MAEWDPGYAGHPYMALYRATLRRIKAAGRPVTGILWWQGESDTFAGQGKVYAANMKNLLAAFRRDLGRPDLPFLYVQIGNCVLQTEDELPEWNLVQDTQRQLEPDLAPGALCTALDLPLWDGIHMATSSQRRLGRRLAKLARRVVYGDTNINIGPRVAAVERDTDEPRILRIRYASVNGRLLPERVAGFSLFMPGEARNQVCSAIVPPDEPQTVLIRGLQAVASGSALWYGKGLTAFCNLVDEADMAAPMFGPVMIAD